MRQNVKPGFEARHFPHKWRTTITCYIINEKKKFLGKTTKLPIHPQYLSLSLIGGDTLEHAVQDTRTV